MQEETIGDLIGQSAAQRLFEGTAEKAAAIRCTHEETDKQADDGTVGGLTPFAALVAGTGSFGTGYGAGKGLNAYTNNILEASKHVPLATGQLSNGDIVLTGDVKPNAFRRGFSPTNTHSFMFHDGKLIGLDGDFNLDAELSRFDRKGLSARVFRHPEVTPELSDAIAKTLRRKRTTAMGADLKTLGLPVLKRKFFDALGLAGVSTRKGYTSDNAMCAAIISEAFKKHKLNILPGNRPATDVNVTLPWELANDKVKFVGTLGQNDYAKQRKSIEKSLELLKKKSRAGAGENPHRLINCLKSPVAKGVTLGGAGLAGLGSLWVKK